MHLPAVALPGAQSLFADPAGQAIAAQAFGPRSAFWAPGPAIITGGDVIVNTLGRGVNIREGTNARMGIATLVAGTVTVSNTAVTANSRILLSGQDSSGAHGELTISARTAGTNFTITSSSGTDTRNVAWLIFEPA